MSNYTTLRRKSRTKREYGGMFWSPRLEGGGRPQWFRRLIVPPRQPGRNGAGQNLEIEAERPVADILGIRRKICLHIAIVPIKELLKTAHSLRHRETRMR